MYVSYECYTKTQVHVCAQAKQHNHDWRLYLGRPVGCVEPLLPVHVNIHRFGGDCLCVSDRHCFDAIFDVLCAGCQRAALRATNLCATSTVGERVRT